MRAWRLRSKPSASGVDEGHLLRTFLETTPDAVYFKDLESRFIKVSHAQAKRFGLDDPDEAIGKTDADFFGTEHARQALADEQAIIRSGKPLIDIEELETWETGVDTWVSTTKLPLHNELGEVVGTYGLSRDITERKLAELEVKANQERMAAIIATQGEIAAAQLDLESVMRLVVDRTQEVTKADGALLQILEGGYLSFKAASGAALGEARLRLPVGATVLGDWLREAVPVTCPDTASDDRLTRPLDRKMLERLGARSLVVVPLLHEQRVVGLLQVVAHRPDAFREADVDTLQLLGVVLSAAMSHAAEFEAKREQVEALAQFAAMYEGAPIGIIFVAPDGTITENNPAAEAILGYPSDELVRSHAADLIHEDDRELADAERMRTAEGASDHYQLELRYRHRNGDVVWANLAASVVRSNGGDPLFTIQMIENITDRKQAEDELRKHAELSEHQSLHDALTGLPNRVLFNDRIQQALLTAEREGGRFAVLLMDLDRFKEINDTLGHACGDEVLKEVARRLNDCLRASDTVARLGGDEFGLLLPKQNERSETVHLLDKLAGAIEQPIELEGLPLGIEGSIGVAFFPDDGHDVSELLKRADVAMYAAKQDHRPYGFYQEGADDYDPLRLTLVGELRRAIECNELELYYQPKAALAGGEITSVEALVRWAHPERGLVQPDDFIPQAQETSLMKPLTSYLLRLALGQIREWSESGLELAVSVNLATRNLIDGAFPEEVASLLEEFEVDASRLELEITESTMLEDPFRTKVVLDRLHAMGIRLSIDDFGTGYSSLAYLRQLPVSEIKIDRSFVMGMAHDRDDEVIVRSTIDLGKNLGLDVVAEGVEDEEAWQALSGFGCKLAQGYFLTRPVPAAELVAWLESRARVESV